MDEYESLRDEINKYEKSNIKPCSENEALRALRRLFRKFYFVNSIEEFFPAIKNGLIKLKKKDYFHNDAVRIYKEKIKTIKYKDLCHAFIYGVTHRAPQYRTALIAYFYLKNIPVHNKIIDYNSLTNRNTTCAICHMTDNDDYTDIVNFIEINQHMMFLYKYGAIPFEVNFDNAAIIIDEYMRLPKVVATKDDYSLFLKTLEIIKDYDKLSVVNYHQVLYSSKLLPMTKQQVSYYIDLLGYLNILHHPNTKGISAEFTSYNNISKLEEELSLRKTNMFTFPVNLWNSTYGVDYDSVNSIFGNMFNE